MTITSEDLERFVALGQSVELAEAVSDLDETARRRFSKHIQKLNRDLEHHRWADGSESLERLKVYLEPVDNFRFFRVKGKPKKEIERWRQLATSNLAILAVGPLSQAKKVQFVFRDEDAAKSAAKVLMDRRPDWIDDWVAAMLDDERPWIDWHTLKTLIDSGVCRKPDSEDYYRGLVTLLNQVDHRHPEKHVPLSDVLEADPDTREDIWKLFEIDSPAFAFDWDTSISSRYESWPQAIYRLAERGTLDRARLLDATLSGQTTGLKQNIISGFAKLHEELKPTKDELAHRQSAYLDLFAVSRPQVVSFAVKQVKKIDQARLLDDALFLGSAGQVFDISTKGPPKSILAIIKKIIKRNPEYRSQVGRLLLDALHHPADDVQGTAVELMAQLADDLEADVVGQLAERIDDLPATLRPQVLELVQHAGAELELPTTDAENDLADRTRELRERISGLDARWRDLAGVDAALTAIDNDTWAGPLTFDLWQVPVLTGVEPVEPIATLDELIDAAAHAIETVDAAIEVERILDGISRFCDQKPDDFQRRVAPLIKRIEKTKDSDTTRGIANEHAGSRELARTVSVWLSGDAHLAKSRWGRQRDSASIMDFLDIRLEALRQRVAQGKPSPLLAMPTHQRGWIDPGVVVQRWLEIQRADSRPAKYEIVQALLRMAPEGRQEALAQAEQLNHRFARALRWALGGDEPPGPDDADDADLWLAAGRARSPFGELAELQAVGLNAEWADTIHPAKYQWEVGVRESKDKYLNTMFRFHEIKFADRPTAHDIKRRAGYPNLLMHHKYASWSPFEAGAPWVYDWITLVWPANLSAFFVIGIEQMVTRLDDHSSSWEPNHVYLPPLFDVDRRWSEVAQLMIAVGLAGKDQDVRGLTIDALVEAIQDGRVHPDSLGEKLCSLSAPYWLKLNRLNENLTEVARVSSLHAWVVFRLLTGLCEHWGELPRDAHYVLALVKELQAQLGLPLPVSLSERLKTIKGSSKTAKLAKSLAASQATPTTAAQEARLLMLEGRVDRAERWSG